MKKFIVLILVGLLVLVFGTTVFAQKKEEPKLDFRASGYINMITFWNENTPGINAAAKIFGAQGDYVTPDANAWNRTKSYLDSRASLKFDAVMGKELSGTIYFEIDSTRWGDIPGAQGNSITDRGRMGYWSADRAAMEVKNIYFDVGLPYIGIEAPMTARVGLQPLAIRPNILVYTDGMGITGGINVDPVMIKPMWFKAVEGVDYTADDVNIYGLHANAKVGTFTIGGYGLYYNMNTFPFYVSQTVIAPITQSIQGTQEADMWWWGVYADGKAGPVNLNFDFIIDRGKVQSKRTPTVDDVNYRGWTTRIKVDYPYEKFNLGVVGVYGSGADRNKTDADGFANGTNSKVGSFVVPVGSESGAISGESVLLSMYAFSSGGTGWAINHNYNQLCRGPTGGIWFAKLYGSVKATPWYKVTLQGLYIGDTTKNGNTFGTAVKTDGTLKDDKGIGWELDLINTLQIYKNLKWEIAGGVLFAGDAMDMRRTATTNGSMSNPWSITTLLIYNF
ncbi:MAG: hypothetical protein MUP27_01945 [Desulfobacterales bacterium]|nr:hypothetical protein [Desulfobacterales bacterium]